MKLIIVLLPIIFQTNPIKSSTESRKILKNFLQNSIIPSYDLSNSEKVTEQCRTHSELVKNAVDSLEMWALKSMLNYWVNINHFSHTTIFSLRCLSQSTIRNIERQYQSIWKFWSMFECQWTKQPLQRQILFSLLSSKNFWWRFACSRFKKRGS